MAFGLFRTHREDCALAPFVVLSLFSGLTTAQDASLRVLPGNPTASAIEGDFDQAASVHGLGDDLR